MVIVLNENKEAAFIYNTPKDEGLQSLSTTGTWEATEHGVNITSNGSTISFAYEDGLLWMDAGKMQIGMKKVDFTTEQLKYSK